MVIRANGDELAESGENILITVTKAPDWLMLSGGGSVVVNINDGG